MKTPALGTLLLMPESKLLNTIREFLIDCQSRRLSPRTLQCYGDELRNLRLYLEAHRVLDVESITAAHLRAFLVDLAERRNPGGCHVAYRVAKTFLRWYENEYEPQGWRNPIAKVKPPKMPAKVLEPVPLDHIQAMLATCERRSYTGDRNRAILLCLLDTGCRASEFLSLNLGDVNMSSGQVIVRSGKGGKGRVVFLGSKARKALLQYLRHRPDAGANSPLWATDDGKRLQLDGLKSVLRRLAAAAHVPAPGPHAFRRSFALLSLRNGANVYALQKLMGHADLTILQRYLAQTKEDLREAHEESGPVDHLL